MGVAIVNGVTAIIVAWIAHRQLRNRRANADEHEQVRDELARLRRRLPPPGDEGPDSET